jgi:hypothetical protein
MQLWTGTRRRSNAQISEQTQKLQEIRVQYSTALVYPLLVPKGAHPRCDNTFVLENVHLTRQDVQVD